MRSTGSIGTKSKVKDYLIVLAFESAFAVFAVRNSEIEKGSPW
jgi:hypothetical protein